MPDHGATCPVCGYDAPIWLGPPPTGCLDGGGQDICQQARTRANGEAVRRQLCPDAFGADGKILPGKIVSVLLALEARGINGMTGYPRTKQGAPHG